MTKAILDQIKTARSTGAVGPRAIVPNYILRNPELFVDKTILDFGCGKHGRHVKELCRAGFKVRGYDLYFDWACDEPGLPDWLACPNWLAHHSEKFDVIYLSNVLNVQANLQAITWTLERASNQLKSGGQLLLNLPKEPWKPSDAQPCLIRAVLEELKFRPVPYWTQPRPTWRNAILWMWQPTQTFVVTAKVT